MYAMDGNNSLKRLAPLGGRRVGDERVFHESDYFLPTSFVNSFARDVRARPTTEAVEEDELDAREFMLTGFS